MTEREIKTAKHFNCLALTENIERELLKLPDVVGVEFDLNGMEYDQFIILTKYDIPGNIPTLDYFRRRRELVNNVIRVFVKKGSIANDLRTESKVCMAEPCFLRREEAKRPIAQARM